MKKLLITLLVLSAGNAMGMEQQEAYLQCIPQTPETYTYLLCNDYTKNDDGTFTQTCIGARRSTVLPDIIKRITRYSSNDRKTNQIIERNTTNLNDQYTSDERKNKFNEFKEEFEKQSQARSTQSSINSNK